MIEKKISGWKQKLSDLKKIKMQCSQLLADAEAILSLKTELEQLGLNTQEDTQLASLLAAFENKKTELRHSLQSSASRINADLEIEELK